MQNLEQKTRDILKKNYKDLPVAKDLPRLAKRISINDAQNRPLLQPGDAPVQEYIPQIFSTLYRFFDEKERDEKLKEGWEACYDDKKELEKVMDRFLAQYVGEESKSLQILKACNQGVISGAVIELKFALGITHTTKDVPNSWFFTVTCQPGTTSVTSTKREVCVQGVFEFQWEFTVSFDTTSLAFQGVSLKVTELVFHKAENVTKIEDVKRILSRFMKKEEEKKSTPTAETNGDKAPSSPTSSDTSWLLPGERITLQNREVEHFVGETCRIVGSVFITTYRVHFIPNPHKLKLAIRTLREELSDITCPDIPLTVIYKPKKDAEDPLLATIWCKDLRSVTFGFKEVGPRDLFYITIKKHIPATLESIFAFSYFSNGGMSRTASSQGWRVYNPNKELERLKLPTDKFRISSVNANFTLCPTYPTALAVPKALQDEDLIAAGVARQGRIPTIIWRHPTTSAFLCRARTPSSPNRVTEDDRLVDALVKANTSNAFYVVDLSSNKDVKNRHNSLERERFETLFVDSLSDLQESFQSLALLCYLDTDEGQWMTELDKTRWFEQTRALFVAATRVAELLEKGFSVLIQSPEDADRVPQLTSLVSLLLDPYYRTITGFEVLIEKEWISFGHSFLKRGGYLLDKDSSMPLFLQFIDSVWQLTQQYPTAFEFNSKFLTTVMHHQFSGLYGTFLSNSPQERVSLSESSASLWSAINQTDKLSEYRNGNYIANGARLLLPSISIKRLMVWSDYYLRWVTDAQPLEQAPPKPTTPQPPLNHMPPPSASAPSLLTGASGPPLIHGLPPSPRGGPPPPLTISLEGIDKLTPRQMLKFKELQMQIETLKRENSALTRQNKKISDKYRKLKGSSKKKRESTSYHSLEGYHSGARTERSPSLTSSAFPGISLRTDGDFDLLIKNSSPLKSTSSKTPKSERTQKPGW